jgi:hypothetical protein
MAWPLLERQVSLVEHLTGGAAIFDGGEDSTVDLEGFDGALLHVEARLSYAKRLEKITAVLPKTFELLGSRVFAVVRAFVDSCPPTTLSRLENACQFHRFLMSRWKREPPDPHYISMMSPPSRLHAPRSMPTPNTIRPMVRQARSTAAYSLLSERHVAALRL